MPSCHSQDFSVFRVLSGICGIFDLRGPGTQSQSPSLPRKAILKSAIPID